METLVILAALYVLLSPRVAMPFYSTMIFYPHKFPIGYYDGDPTSGIKGEDVFFAGKNGKELHGWFFPCPGARKTVLISHGNAGNLTYRTALCKLLMKAGASVFVYDYQGYGKSEGAPSLAGICDDGLAAFAWLVDVRKIQPSDIVHLGESLGSVVACHAARERPCAGIILQSGLFSFERIAREVLPYLYLYPPWLMPDQRLDNAAILSSSHPPLLLVHGARDDVVPVAHSQALFARAVDQKRLVVLPDAGHNDIYTVNSDLYMEAVRKFLSELPE